MRLFAVSFVIIFLSSCYSNQVYVVNKRSVRLKGKIVTARGRVKSWYPALDYGFYLIILENRGRKIAVYKQVPFLRENQKLLVRGKFYPAGSLLALPYNLVVDSSIYHFDLNRAVFFKRDTIDFIMQPRYKLPEDCQ